MVGDEKPHAPMKLIPHGISPAAYNDVILERQGSGRDPLDGTASTSFINESKVNAHGLNDVIEDDAGAGEVQDVGSEAPDELNEILEDLESLSSPAQSTTREEVVAISSKHDALAVLPSTYANLKKNRAGTFLNEAHRASEAEVQVQGSPEKIQENCVYGPTLQDTSSLVRRVTEQTYPPQFASPPAYVNASPIRVLARDDRSAYSSTDNHSSDTSFDINDRLRYDGTEAGDGRSTPQTSIGEGVSISDTDGSLKKGDMMKSRHAHELLLGMDTVTKNSAIGLGNIGVQPRQHVKDALSDFKRVELSLKHDPRPLHPSLELGSACSINVGFGPYIYRWKLGSTITFNVDRRSFPDSSYASHAAKSLEQAACKWNEGEIGVQFKRVADHEPATFRLIYEHQDPTGTNTIAKASPPIPIVLQPQQLHIFVYSIAFGIESGNYQHLDNIFCHELGHILGLRHEFAKERERNLPCTQIGGSNSSSVMNYFDHAREYRIRNSDYNDVRLFHAYEGTIYNGFPIINVDPLYFTPPLRF
ncbi:hypothetical protein GGR53DRAFT_464070 [Hypoxylon sp. FL1150]|nr:hypothetical protein GGR53DRAFT_464070 [Hypoxylon sp. FL1150]